MLRSRHACLTSRTCATAPMSSAPTARSSALHRVVVKRSDLSLTHVVVDIGFLRSGRRLWEGGLGLDYDRLVWFGDVASANDKRVELAITVEQFKAMPEYTDESYEQPEDRLPESSTSRTWPLARGRSLRSLAAFRATG